jgi:hypothetical protein
MVEVLMEVDPDIQSLLQDYRESRSAVAERRAEIETQVGRFIDS